MSIAVLITEECDETMIFHYVKNLLKPDVVKVGMSLGIASRRLSDKSIDDIHIALINSWLAKQDYVGIPTLRSLIKAFRGIGLEGKAKEIEKDYSSATVEDCCKYFQSVLASYLVDNVKIIS